MLRISRLFALCFCASLAFAAGPTTQAVNSPQTTLNNLSAYNVDLRTATGDVATIAIPAVVTTYQITAVKVYGCSTTPIAASISIWTGPGGTGTNVVAASTITGATSSNVVLSETLATSISLSSATIYIRLGIANVAALTCNVHLDIDDLT